MFQVFFCTLGIATRNRQVMIIYLENQLASYALKLLPIMLYRADVPCISIVGVIIDRLKFCFYAIANAYIMKKRFH